MTIATLADYQAQCQQERSFSGTSKFSLPAQSGRLNSLWTAPSTDQGAIPTVAAVPTRATQGAAELTPAVNTQRVVMMEAINDGACMMYLFDRLSHQGGLSAIVAGAQATNLPTAALTRYTTGLGVWAFLEIYTLIGATATTFTVSYTNEAGVAGRTSPAVAIGATTNREVARMFPIPLQSGDMGVRAVASVNLLATTGTAGNFGVTLARLLGIFPMIGSVATTLDMLRGGGAQMPTIDPNACLFWGCRPAPGGTGSWMAQLTLSEE